MIRKAMAQVSRVEATTTHNGAWGVGETPPKSGSSGK
ncbi:hypothetical protein Tco_0675335, partial [Tanacetum coccineum]